MIDASTFRALPIVERSKLGDFFASLGLLDRVPAPRQGGEFPCTSAC
jgi:hypothetical protein